MPTRSALRVLVPFCVLSLAALVPSLSAQFDSCGFTDPNCGLADETPPTVGIDPASATTGDSVLAVTVGWGDNVGLSAYSRSIRLNGQAVTSSFTYEPLGSVAQSHGTVRLVGGVNTLDAYICDTSGNCTSGSATYLRNVGAVDTAGVPQYGVTVTPDGLGVSTVAGGRRSQGFVVRNTGNRTATYTLAVTCAGAGVSQCLGSRATVTVGPYGWAGVAVTHQAGAAGTSGTVSLRATQSSPTVASAPTAAGTVTVSPAARPLVGYAGMPERRDMRDRSHCLQVAVAEGAAYDCSDLRLVHALPGVSLLNKGRAPVLIYNSGHAYSHPLVSVRYTPPAGSTPTQVRGVLSLPDGRTITAHWPGWAGGTERVVTMGFDAAGLNNGVHDYTLAMTPLYGSTLGAEQRFSGQVPVLHRRQSPFGQGWTLAGLERIALGPGGYVMLWEGADGSLRQYRLLDSGYQWEARHLHGGADTITWHVADGLYERKLRGGGAVAYDSHGRQVATVNRLWQYTQFVWSADGSRLERIHLSNTGQFQPGLVYRFEYAHTSSDGLPRLSRVVAPHDRVPGDRDVVVGMDAQGRLTSLTDPASPAVRFEYGDATARVHRRINRAGTVAHFRYDGGSRLAVVKVDVEKGDSVVTRITPQESRGLANAAGTASAVSTGGQFTLLNGPLPDSAGRVDHTYFWLNRLGAPVRIRDAAQVSAGVSSKDTHVFHDDPRFPALATRVRYPNGREVTASYDWRGRTESTTDWSVPGYATTVYTWDDRWDALTGVTGPEGEVSLMGYDSITGHRIWQQTGTDPRRRVQFSYFPTTDASAPGLLRTVSSPSGNTHLEYDARGNLARTITPLGDSTALYKDAIGRDTLVVPEGGPSVRTVYDAAGLVERTQSFGGGDTITVSHTYSPAGQVLSTTRLMAPDSNRIGEMTQSWGYDALGRVVRETASDGSRDTTVYDKASRPVRARTHRGYDIKMRYDVLGRLVERITPPAGYYTRRSEDFLGRDWIFPSRPLDPDTADPTVITGDTALFTYDDMGNLRSATNRDARIFRGYDLTGRLVADTLQISTYEGRNYSSHQYVTTRRYDRSGRRVVLRYPANLVARAGRDSVTYTYEPETGALSTVRDLNGGVFGFSYGDEGDLVLRTSPGGMVDSLSYDDDGRLVRRSLRANNPFVGQSSGYNSASVILYTLSYNRQGKIEHASGSAGGNATMDYTGLGAVKLFHSDPSFNFIEQIASVVDPLGNLRSERRATQDLNADWGKGDNSVRYWYQSGTGRQMAMRSTDVGKNVVTSESWSSYDGAGNRDGHNTAEVIGSGETLQERTRSYYGADDKLRVVDRQRCMTRLLGETTPNCAPWKATLKRDPSAFEEYRYDALGRRVLVQRRLYTINGTSAGICGTACSPGAERIIWDGDQILTEIRAPEGSEYDASTGDHYGRVLYTHGGQIDQPLSLVRVGGPVPDTLSIIPHVNWRGMYQTANFSDGSLQQETFHVSRMPLPGENMDRFLGSLRSTQPDSWFGSLLTGMRDASGQMYRRNRLYDPQTGRFTQEDPIGLAGGLNLYGFGGGDPVNYRDPFGLSATKIVVIGNSDYQNRVIATMRYYAERSSTFRRIYNAMAVADMDVARVNIAARPLNCRDSMNGGCTVSIFRGISNISVPENVTDDETVIHELIHAAGHLSERLELDVPQACKTHNDSSECVNRYMEQIRKEVGESERQNEREGS